MRGGGGLGVLVEPLCWVDFVSLHCSVVGVDAGELDVLAEVIPALLAEETLVAWHARLHGHAVACGRVS